MGSLKRKRTSSPESPAPSKKRTAEEGDPPSSSEEAAAEETVVKLGKDEKEDQQPTRQGDAARGEAPDGKKSRSQESSSPVKLVQAPKEVAVVPSTFEQDVENLQNGISAGSVENLSQGQGVSFSGRHLPVTAAPTIVTPTGESDAQSQSIAHLVPSHAGWFQWTQIHLLERLALPEYFSGKNSQKTPETFIAQRNSIITKYRENPPKLLKYEDVQGSLKGDLSGAHRLFGFLDHWGLINYQATSDFTPFLPSHGLLGGLEETSTGSLQLSPLLRPALSNLFQFETASAPVPKLLSPDPSSNVPLSSLAEAAVQESLAAPSVEYHCNSCQADCSKRRYHCQKQADFDVCPDCYSDGKFGQGMTSTDFLRMDAITEPADANGGGWSDQETLLLLEALELYGDNWTEIAEHVATKSKSQCILHFIRLPIEDPFLEDMEESKAVTEIQPPPAEGSVAKASSPKAVVNEETKALVNEETKAPPRDGDPAVEAPEVQPSPKPSQSNQESGKGEPVTSQSLSLTVPPGTDSYESTEKPDKASNEAKPSNGTVDSSAKKFFLIAAESARCGGPDGLVAFSDAGNPVMTQVAFLAAMVGPRVAAAAAQAALKSLAEEDPVGFLSAKNSFALDASVRKDGVSVPESHERLITGGQDQGDQAAVPLSDPSASAGTTREALSVAEDGKSESHGKGSTGSTPGEDGAGQAAQKRADTMPADTAHGQQKAPSLVKVRNAAASALASAAVKAKLLADQEEREIQRLVAGVVENQLKKLEVKLKHFSELEALLGKECEQVEKARAKVYAERARIIASRLGSPSSTTQTHLPPPTSSSYARPATQPKPAVFTFGPGGMSSPSAVYKASSGSETTVSLPGDAANQRGGSQNLSDPITGNSLASAVKLQQ